MTETVAGTTDVAAKGLDQLNPTHSNVQENPNLIHIHIAEYQALTTRSTYWILIQSALWPMLILFITLVAQVYKESDSRWLVWVSVVIVETVVFQYYASLLEQYRNIVYIEQRLRPLMVQTIGKTSFWQYESWLADQRGNGPHWWEYGPLVIPAGSIIIGIVLRHQGALRWDWGDWIGVCVSIAGGYVTWQQARNSHRIRKNFFTTAG